jgi:sialate O-acetylesterase
LTFDHVGRGLTAFDVPEPRGFAIASSDQKFVWAEAKLVGKDQVEVWSDRVSEPVSVRYAWADNPVCNLYSQEGLPVTPFRTDDWPGKTADRKK